MGSPTAPLDLTMSDPHQDQSIPRSGKILSTNYTN